MLRFLLFCGVGVALLVLFFVTELVYIKFNGKQVPAPDIPRAAGVIGQGTPLTYVVLGDSTAVSQGGDYAQGYATATAHYLAQKYRVSWSNLAVPGTRAADIASRQAPEAVKLRPDVALVAVGANDVTHLTSVAAVRTALQKTVDILRQASPNVHIVLTGAPDMGSVPRLPQPLRWLAGVRTHQINAMVAQLARDQQLVFAPIAKETGSVYRAHPELFAADKFHPTTAGYLLWIPVLERALNQALHLRQ